MNISAYGDGCSNRYSVCLLGENGCSFLGDEFGLFFSNGLEVAKVVDDCVDLYLVTHFKYKLCSAKRKSGP